MTYPAFTHSSGLSVHPSRPLVGKLVVFPVRAAVRALAITSFAAAAAAQNPPAAPAARGVAIIHGTVLDSLHEGLLAGALVRVDNSTRESITDSLGRYRIDSVPSGQHRLVVIHPVLDTLSISLVTPPMNFGAGDEHLLDLSVPSGETLVSVFCPAARRA